MYLSDGRAGHDPHEAKLIIGRPHQHRQRHHTGHRVEHETAGAGGGRRSLAGSVPTRAHTPDRTSRTTAAALTGSSWIGSPGRQR